MIRHILQVFFIIAFIAILGMEVYIGSNRYSSDAQVMGQSAALFITAGRTTALLAAMMIMLQFALVARFKILDHTFGFGRLIKFHSIMGTTAVVLAASHPLLLYTPKVYSLGALRLALWPELLGILALTMLAIIIVTTLGRTFLQLKFQTWRKIHHLTFAVAAIVAVHSLVLGSNLKDGWPRLVWLMVIAAYAAAFIWGKLVKPYK
jgi:predicted ferric reductase